MAKSTPSGTRSIPEKMREKHDVVLKLIDDFCRAQLNEEYAVMCRRLVGVLARKRPSPIINGTPAAWACGIVRAIGYVNFLDDKTQQPHMKMPQIDQHFGVSAATGQARSKSIRDLFKMRPFDMNWTLPSRMDANPMAWMIQVNGMFVDARWMPRDVQEEALRLGLIPYLPMEKSKDSADEPNR